MSEDHLRRRRERTDTYEVKTPKAVAKVQVEKRPRLRLSSIGLGIFVLLLTYFYSQTLLDLFNSWIGTSDWESTVQDVNPDAVVDFTTDFERRSAIVEAFKHAWYAYERDAMGYDEYSPIQKKGSNLSETGGIGYTIVDALDTMLIMGLGEEYMRARNWVENEMSFNRNGTYCTFELTIRVLGGLLSAYHLSGQDPIFLQRAVDLADRILPAFDTPSGFPLTNINLGERRGIPDVEFPKAVSTAEISALQLEFRYLSFLTDDDTYWHKVEQIMARIKSAELPHGLASIYMDVDTGQFLLSAIRLGSRGDSYYEYLLKQYLQTNRVEDVYRTMYEKSMQGIHDNLIRTSINERLIYTAELYPQSRSNGETSWRLSPKQDHLVCFLGGSLLLGATTIGARVDRVSIPPQKEELTPSGLRDWSTGMALTKTCVNTHDTATGLSPEIVHFRIPGDGMGQGQEVPFDWYIKGAKLEKDPSIDARYILRPETIESLFIAFRLTGDVQYRDQGWKIFQAIQKHCRIPTGGYAGVKNVDQVPVVHEDRMETFFLGETLKYLYLLFSDNSLIPLDKYVFNTEAHPLPIFVPTIRTGFS